MDKLKIIKTIVILLTFLLVFGTLCLLGLVWKKTRAPLPVHEVSYNLEQPQGSSIAAFDFDDNHLYLLIKNGGRSDRLIIYNRQTDQASTVINLN